MLHRERNIIINLDSAMYCRNIFYPSFLEVGINHDYPHFTEHELVTQTV